MASRAQYQASVLINRVGAQATAWLSMLLILTATLIALLAPAANADVQLIPAVDAGRVGQPFELTIEAAQFQSVTGTPDLTALKQDFRILSNRSVYLTEKRTGRTVYVSRWTLSLSPIRPGALVIPAIQVKGEWSQPLPFQVHPKPRQQTKPLQLKTSLSSTEAYQGGPLSLSVQLFYNIALQSAELTQPKIDGVRILRRGEQRSYSQQVDQQRYQVIEQQYWIQALRPGRFRLPSLQFSATDSLGKSITGQSRPLDFAISALPDRLSSQIQLVATEVQLQQQWQIAVETPRAGDTLVRSISIEAQGIPAQWLPDLQLPTVDGISVYPQPAKFEQTETNGVLISRKQVDFKLLLTQSGSFELPGIKLDWWDIASGNAATTELEPMTLQVAPFSIEADTGANTTTEFTDENQISDPQPEVDSTDNPIQWQAWIWALIAVICAGGWTLSQQRNSKLTAQLARIDPNRVQASSTEQTQNTTNHSSTALATTESPQHTQSQPSTSGLHNSFEELAEACQLNDPELAYERLFDWASIHWPQVEIDSLEDIEQMAKDPTLTYLLKNLEHQLLDPSDSWHGDLLLERIERLRQQSRQKPRPQLQAASQPRHRSQPAMAATTQSQSPPQARAPFRTKVGD